MVCTTTLVMVSRRSEPSTVGSFERSPDTDGRRPWRPEYVTKRFTELRDEVGLTGRRLHDLRHFMATEMINAGVPIPIVSNRLAHARSSTTMNVYAHAVPGATETPRSASLACSIADSASLGSGAFRGAGCAPRQ